MKGNGFSNQRLSRLLNPARRHPSFKFQFVSLFQRTEGKIPDIRVKSNENSLNSTLFATRNQQCVFAAASPRSARTGARKKSAAAYDGAPIYPLVAPTDGERVRLIAGYASFALCSFTRSRPSRSAGIRVSQASRASLITAARSEFLPVRGAHAKHQREQQRNWVTLV